VMLQESYRGLLMAALVCKVNPGWQGTPTP